MENLPNPKITIYDEIEKKIPTFIINLEKRIDRKQSILAEFKGKLEFDVKLIPACEHNIGAVGLWETLCKIVRMAMLAEHEFILICEDDHKFTSAYNKGMLLASIKKAYDKNADLLLGGVSWLDSIVPVSSNCFWTNRFSGGQFMLVFKRFFDNILNAVFFENDAADYKISSLSNRIFFTFPFISIQEDFGYSDVTPKNNLEGRVPSLFKHCAESVEIFKKVISHYETCATGNQNQNGQFHFDDMKISTYVINLPERGERKEHIKQQFNEKIEFDTRIVEACRHDIGALGLWLSIRKVIGMAIESDDDVIIICEDDHEFTSDYSKEYLMRNIIEAHLQGTDFLSGGSGGVFHAIPVASNRFWTAECLSTQFLIIYKKFFLRILEEPFDEGVIADKLLSEMTASKLLLFPFISRQRDFGYSDVTHAHNETKGLLNILFINSVEKLSIIHTAYKELCW